MGIKEKKEKKEEERKFSILLEDLTALENYARELFSFLPLPVLLLSPLKIILEVNVAFEELSGNKIEDVVGKSIDEFFNREKIERLIEETTEKGFVKAREMQLFINNKKKIPVSISTMLRKSDEGESVGCFLGIFDLAEIKKKEEEIKEKLGELEIFNKLAIGRELKMIELKQEIENLKKELNKNKAK